MRYQFYREHKYVSAALNDVERLIARTDFRQPEAVQKVAEDFEALTQMLHGHAQYENERLHTLLQKKNSTAFVHAAQDHAHQDKQILEIQHLIEQVAHAEIEEEKITKGYQLYLTYRKFVAENLLHLHEEETEILPELQRLYTDEELQQVEALTYRMMTPEEIVHMIKVLFPYMNPTDQKAVLEDIKKLAPEKFERAWAQIKPLLADQEPIEQKSNRL